MDIEVNTLAQIKAETGRDLDNQIDENTLVSGEKSNGTFGVFKLFAAIKNCIDNWITTIAGAKNFTGAVTINSKAVATTEAVNNALTDYGSAKKNVISTPTDLNTIVTKGEYIPNTDNVANACTNKPKTTTYSFVLTVQTTDNGIIVQTMKLFNNTSFQRTTANYGATWTDWEQKAVGKPVLEDWRDVTTTTTLEYTGKFVEIPPFHAYSLAFYGIYAVAQPLQIGVSYVQSPREFEWVARSENNISYVHINGFNNTGTPRKIFIFQKCDFAAENNYLVVEGALFNFN